MKCIQCGSLGCGWDVCRFSGKTKEQFLRDQAAANAYANEMVQRDKEQPKWLRDFKTGARDADVTKW